MDRIAFHSCWAADHAFLAVDDVVILPQTVFAGLNQIHIPLALDF
jgi:hypothetical protein